MATQSASRIDRSRANYNEKGFSFVPLRPKPRASIPLAQAKLPPARELLVFERGGEHRALIAREMAYHHVAQGELAGEPYLVSF